MDFWRSKSKSPSLKSIDSGQGSSKSISGNGKPLSRKIASSLESLRSLTASTLGSQMSIASIAGGDEKKKKSRRFGSFRKKHKSDPESVGSGGLKRSKSLLLFRKKPKDPFGPEKVSSGTQQDLPPKFGEAGLPPLAVVPEDPEMEIVKLKRKLSLIRAFKKKLKGNDGDNDKDVSPGKLASQPGTSGGPSMSNVANPPHLIVDLEEEPKRIQSSRSSSTTAINTEDIPWIEEDNPEILQGQAPDLSQSPSLPLQDMITSEENQSAEDVVLVPESPPLPPEPEPSYFNYSASAQRIRIKKPNLQRQTLERIFLQRRESESEAEAAAASEVPIPEITVNGVEKEHEEEEESSPGEENVGVLEGEREENVATLESELEENIAVQEVEQEKDKEVALVEASPSPLETELGIEAVDAEEEDDEEVKIREEYLHATLGNTVSVSVHPDPESMSMLTFPKRLSIISECESENGSQTGFSTSVGLVPEMEHSTIRRASDFTDSFRKLEPFKFDLPAVIEGKRERLYKVLVVGELGTGKTSIIKRYVHQFFSQHYRATIGVDFALKVLRWDPETVVRLQLWDIAGQERFGSMTRVYYKEAVGAFVVFDVARAATLEAVPKWKADLDSKVVLPDGRSIPAVLLANKSDQPKEGLAANREKMNEFCQQQGFSAWFETSAKENINIDEAANFLVSKILEMDKWSQEPISTDPDKVGLRLGNGGKTTVSGCAC